MGGVFGKKKGPIVVTAPPQVEQGKKRFKVILIGDPGVGKTSILVRLATGGWTDSGESLRLGSDFKEMQVGGKTYQLWDTGGQERFRTITSSYYRGADTAVVVIELSNGDSYFNAKTWFTEVERYASDRITKILVANKADLVDKRVVDRAALQEMSETYGVEVIEVSAKDGTGMTELADKLVALNDAKRL